MIKKESKEYASNGQAVFEMVIKLFGLPIYKRKDLTTNSKTVNDLKPIKTLKQVKGFSNETKN